MKYVKTRKKCGFTLIEVLIELFILTAIFGALVASFIWVMRTVNNGKVRTLASALANEQMEQLHGLPYDQLATQTGTIVPPGDIPDSQVVSRNGASFTLKTTIIFVDKPLDGCGIPDNGIWLCTDGETSSTQDVSPIDYKRITIETLQVGSPIVLARLSSDTAAFAAETLVNTGMLLVIVLDASGLPVPMAEVHITNANVVPTVDIIGYTNDSGRLFVSGIPPDSHNTYHIVATKDGYSTDYTISRTPQNPNQDQRDVSIYVQQVTTQTLTIDHLTTMNVTVKDQAGAALPNVAITATGQKLIETNPKTPKNTFTQTSNASGLATFANIEWDGYDLAPQSNYYIITTNPYQSIEASPGTTVEITMQITTDADWPRIENVSPKSASINTIVQVTITGANFDSGTTVRLIKVLNADILPTVLDIDPNKKSLVATFNLTGAAVGAWDILVSSNSKDTRQIEGLTISP